MVIILQQPKEWTQHNLCFLQDRGKIKFCYSWSHGELPLTSVMHVFLWKSSIENEMVLSNMKLTITEEDIFSHLLFVLSTLLANRAALPKIRSSMLKVALPFSRKKPHPTIKACGAQRWREKIILDTWHPPKAGHHQFCTDGRWADILINT